MTATVLNIHEFYNDLKGVGFNEQQAELIANLHSKSAAAAVEQAKHDYKLDDVASKRDIKELELLLSIQIEKSRNDLIKWFVGTAFAIASIGFMLARFFEHGVI